MGNQRLTVLLIGGGLLIFGIVGYSGYLYGKSTQIAPFLPTSAPRVTEPSIAYQLDEQTANWPVYKNDEYKLKFSYPPYLVIESPPFPTESLLRVDFIGKECANVPVLERGHTPSLNFTVNKTIPEEDEWREDLCSEELGPNCRGKAIIGPVPLNNGLTAKLMKVFGVSGDGTSLTVTRSGLNFIFGTGSGPVPCGTRSEYIKEIFQMANTLVFEP